MLCEEEGDEILSCIAANPSVSPEVRHFCLSILELLRVEGLMREFVPLTKSGESSSGTNFRGDVFS